MKTEEVKAKVRHYKGTMVAAILCIIVVIYVGACESKVQSLVKAGVKVNRVELKLELDNLIKTAEYRMHDLDKQDAIKQKIAEVGMALAAGGTVNPIGVAVSLTGLMGIGLIADNSKKDSLIKALQNKNNTKV